MLDLSSLVGQYRLKGVLVDTNLLIVFLIGLFDPRQLVNCRATKNFDRNEFHVLKNFLDQFETIVTTPHILTEVSNLSGKLPASVHVSFRRFFAACVDLMAERFVTAQTICQDADFVRFGFADTAVTLLAPGQFLVLTDEFALAGALGKRGVDVVNFTQIRFPVKPSKGLARPGHE